MTGWPVAASIHAAMAVWLAALAPSAASAKETPVAIDREDKPRPMATPELRKRTTPHRGGKR